MITGGIKTPFFSNNSDYSFPDDSPYKAAKGILEPILAGRTTAMFRSESSTTIVTPGLLSTILILSAPSHPRTIGLGGRSQFSQLVAECQALGRKRYHHWLVRVHVPLAHFPGKLAHPIACPVDSVSPVER